jgi:rod shape-determining protein MreD
MPQSSQMVYLWSGVSVVLGLMLQILPISATMAHWRPQFVLLVVFYWLFRSPFLHGITFAWLAGLLLDIFVGELFGRHAMVFALCAYLLQLLQQRLHHFGVFHQAMLVLLMAMMSQLLLHSITLIFRSGWEGNLLIAPAITSAFIWPLLVWLANHLLRMQQMDRSISSKT